MQEIAYDYQTEDEPDYELIGGEKFYMAAAAPFVNHITVVSRLHIIFGNYIDSKNIEAFVMSDADVYLSNTEHYRPDLSIICDLDKVKNLKRVEGAPDLVVEVMSMSTAKNDLGVKKDAYEKFGVKEYWIVDQWAKSIQVYHLVDGRYKLDNVYRVSTNEDEPSITDIKVSIFDDLIVDVHSVFKWCLS